MDMKTMLISCRLGLHGRQMEQNTGILQNLICKAKGGGNKMLREICGVDIKKWPFKVWHIKALKQNNYFLC